MGEPVIEGRGIRISDKPIKTIGGIMFHCFMVGYYMPHTYWVIFQNCNSCIFIIFSEFRRCQFDT
jgi:hypothetical protein